MKKLILFALAAVLIFAAYRMGNTSSYAVARSILGNDFITAEEISKARPGITYSDGLLIWLHRSVPSKKTLEWCRKNNYMLIAGPPTPMTLLDVHRLNPAYFEAKTLVHFGGKDWRDDKIGRGWHMIRKDPVPNSIDWRDWDGQRKLLSYVEKVPNAGQFSWAVTSYKAVRGVYLFPNICVRTSSRSVFASRLCFCDFDDKGLFVGHWYDILHAPETGVSAARRWN